MLKDQSKSVYQSLYGLDYQPQKSIKQIIAQTMKSSAITDLINTEKTNVRLADKQLFTVSAVHQATELLIENAKVQGESEAFLIRFISEFWSAVADSCNWFDINNTAKDKRLGFITALPYIITAIGTAGGICYQQKSTYKPLLDTLESAEWKRDTKLWFSFSVLMRDDMEQFNRFIRLKLLYLCDCSMLCKEDLLAYQMLNSFSTSFWAVLDKNEACINVAKESALKNRLPFPKSN